MAKYQITAPDGGRYEITAPDDATEESVIEYAKSQFAAQQQPAKPSPEPVTAGEMATDVAKSAGMGLAQGAIGLATLPGNLEALGRAGINAGAGMVGIKPPVANETYLTSYDDAKRRIEPYTGKFYEPKTTLGKYARTIGEFAPLAVGGGAGLAARATRVAAPAVASEAAGQMTQGTAVEPWARVGGALVGGQLPAIGRRIATPAPADPTRAAAVQVLEGEGVNALTAGQRTGSMPLRWLEDATATVTGGGGRAVAAQTRAAEQFTAATLRRAGIQSDRASPDVMNAAFNNIGQEYRALGVGIDATGPITITAPFTTRLNAIATNYERLTPPSLQVPRVSSLVDEIANAGPNLSGEQYVTLYSELRRVQRSIKDNPLAQNAFGDMATALEAQMVRTRPARALQQQWHDHVRDLNTRYRNMIAIENAAGAAGEQAAAGLISPAALKNAVKAQNKRDYTRGRSELAQLARAGEQVLKPLKSSGTAERGMAQDILSAPGSIAGVAVGGADPVSAAVGAVAPWAAKAGTAQFITAPIVQRMLANQRFAAPAAPPAEMRSVLPLLPVLPQQYQHGILGER